MQLSRAGVHVCNLCVLHHLLLLENRPPAQHLWSLMSPVVIYATCLPPAGQLHLKSAGAFGSGLLPSHSRGAMEDDGRTSPTNISVSLQCGPRPC